MGYGQGRPQDSREPTTHPVPSVASGTSLAADGSIVRDGAVADRGRVALTNHEPAANAVARKGASRIARSADCLVVGQRQAAGGQGTPRKKAHQDRAAAAHADIQDAAPARIAAASQGLVVVERAVRDR